MTIPLIKIKISKAQRKALEPLFQSVHKEYEISVNSKDDIEHIFAHGGSLFAQVHDDHMVVVHIKPLVAEIVNAIIRIGSLPDDTSFLEGLREKIMEWEKGSI